MNINAPKTHEIPQLRRLWQEAFGDEDKFLDAFFASAFSPERALCARCGDRIAGALYWFSCECSGRRIAYIYAVATLKAYRGQGICRALMAAAHERLKRLGYSGAILVPGEKSLFDFYGRIGYETATSIRKLTCASSGEAVPINHIDKTEYANLRRQYLPENGVIQEHENLDFLATQMQFYKGTDFIMAATVDGDTLYCPEILGNTEKIEQITAVFGCKTGHFRTTGGNTPFAMYYALDKNPQPQYFGLAFD